MAETKPQGCKDFGFLRVSESDSPWDDQGVDGVETLITAWSSSTAIGL